MNILIIVGYVLAIGVGALGGFYGYKKTLTEKAIKFKEKMNKVKEIEEEMLEEAKKKADKTLQNAEEKAQKIEDQRLAKMEEIQNRLLAREEKMDQKLEKLEEEKKKILEKQKEADDVIKQQNDKLSEIAGFSIDKAKEHLFKNIEEVNKKEISEFIEKFKVIKKEEAEKEAAMIVSQTLPRIAADSVTEFTTQLVDLPNEDFKGKLIGREGRNISYFEKITGVELVIDDTPLVVRLSSFDSEKRFIAQKTLEMLVKDGRINPFYIEKIHNQVLEELDSILTEKGKEALNMLNLPMMKPEIVRTIGQFYLRYSYGQNLRTHSIEVAKIAEAIATELGLDPVMAKKAGLLHDIGKVVSTGGQSHSKLGAELLKKYGMDPVIINAAESHHFDVPMIDSISRVIATADAMSASRPGARFNTKDLFIEKMSDLEKLIYDIPGIDKVHIMQAGREIMVYVDPKAISDLEVEKLLKDIGIKIEEQLDYPGIIRVTGIRETKIIEYLR
ncbi:ribonuclease Y [Candidatus Gracilibacteria bacterium]|nr:ribonuclease Y [Candidatus Gracilibacteria bacterium]